MKHFAARKKHMRHSFKPFFSHAAFTLIEMIVVLAIVAVVAAVAVPTAFSALRNVKQAACNASAANTLSAYRTRLAQEYLVRQDQTDADLLSLLNDSFTQLAPQCPSGGQYTCSVKNGVAAVTCSIHGAAVVSTTSYPFTPTSNPSDTATALSNLNSLGGATRAWLAQVTGAGAYVQTSSNGGVAFVQGIRTDGGVNKDLASQLGQFMGLSDLTALQTGGGGQLSDFKIILEKAGTQNDPTVSSVFYKQGDYYYIQYFSQDGSLGNAYVAPQSVSGHWKEFANDESKLTGAVKLN